MEDAVRLQTQYPGTNAAHIAQQQAVVVSGWSALQERSATRREMLQASCDLQRFLAQVPVPSHHITLPRHQVHSVLELTLSIKIPGTVHDLVIYSLLKFGHF